MIIMKREILTAICIISALPALTAQEKLTLTYEQCREMALKKSEELLQAKNRVHQAELDNKIAGTAYLPNVSGSAIGAYILPDLDMMGMELRMRGTYMAGLSLTQPVYTGGRINAGKRMAKIGEEVAGEQLRMTRMEIIVEVCNSYWSYVAVGEKVKMLESYVVQMDTLYGQVSTAVKAGMATENDLLRVEAERSNIRYQLQKASNGKEMCSMSLCRLIGADSGTAIEATDTVIATCGMQNLAAGIEKRPELKMLQGQVGVVEQQLRMARAEMLPTIGSSIGYTYFGNIKMNGYADAGGGTMVPYSEEFREGMGTAMLSISIPVFHWGEGRKKVRKARYELENAQLELEKNRKLLSLEAEQAANNLEESVFMIETAIAGVKHADENLRVTRNRYGAAMATLTELLDSQSQWQQAKSNLIEAKTQYKIYETQYLRATGTLE